MQEEGGGPDTMGPVMELPATGAELSDLFLTNKLSET